MYKQFTAVLGCLVEGKFSLGGWNGIGRKKTGVGLFFKYIKD